MDNEAFELLSSGSVLFRTTAILLSTVAAAGAASLVIPQILDRLLPPPTQDRLGDYLLFDHMVDNAVIRMTDKRYCAVISILGAELTLCRDEDHEDLFTKRKHLFDEIQKKTQIDQINVFQVKQRSPIAQKSMHRPGLLKDVAEKWNDGFHHTYRLRHFMVVFIRAPNDEEAVELMDDATRFIIDSLSDFKCTLLREGEDGQRHEGPLAALASVISPVTRPVPNANGWNDKLSYLLTADQVNFREEKRGVITFRGTADTKHAIIVNVRDCGEKTMESVMKDILAINGELTVYHSIQPINTAKEMLTLTRQAKSAPFMNFSLTAAEEYTEVIKMAEGQSGNKAALLNYSMHVVIYGDTIQECTQIESQVNAILARTGGTPVREHKTAQAVWFSMFQYDKFWPRMYRMLSSNVAANMYLQRMNEGMKKSDWLDEPLSYFKSMYGAAYALQLHATEERQAPGHAVMIGPTGRGKAQPLTAIVQTPHGPRKIGDLQVGELVFGEDGKPHSITGIYPQGRKSNWRVSFEDGRIVECCDEHLWTVFNPENSTGSVEGLKKGEWQTLPLKEVIRRFPTRAGKRLAVPLSQPVEYDEKDLPIAPYTLGALIGDGSYTENGVGFATKDQEIIDRMTLGSPSLIFTLTGGCSYRIAENSRGRPSPLREALRKLGIFGQRSASKQIPLDYLYGSVQQRFQLIQGLMDTDGTVSEGGSCSYSTVSKELADQVAYLLRGLGYRATITQRVPYYTYGGKRLIGSTAYSVFIRGDISRLFAVERKRKIAETRKERKGAPRLRFSSFEYIGEEEMVCISVSNPSKLYLTNDFVVTHNTTFVSFLAGQAMRIPNLRTFFFDRHDGLRVFTECVGGKYVTFTGDSGATMNPLHLAPNDDNRAFLVRFLKTLAKVDTPDAEQEITRAVTTILSDRMPANRRRLKDILNSAFSAHGGVRANLKRWTDPGAYGSYFNAEKDTLDLNVNRMISFDMTNILREDASIATPVMDYITHRLRMLSRETGDPCLIFIDETEPMLANPDFAKNFVKVGLQEGRKARQAYILAFQRAEAIKQAGMSELIRGQCQTGFFFRNPTANAADYDEWDLNPAELNFVLGKEFEGYPYAVLVKKYATGESAVLDINMNSLGRYFNAYQSGNTDIRALHRMKEKHGEDFLDPYLDLPR